MIAESYGRVNFVLSETASLSSKVAVYFASAILRVLVAPYPHQHLAVQPLQSLYNCISSLVKCLLGSFAHPLTGENYTLN